MKKNQKESCTTALLKPRGPSPATKTNPDEIESALMLPLALERRKLRLCTAENIDFFYLIKLNKYEHRLNNVSGCFYVKYSDVQRKTEIVCTVAKC